MELHGTLPENLRATLASVRRHRGHPVYQDTLDYWEQLLDYARDLVRKGKVGAEAAELTRQISLELLEREQGKSGSPAIASVK